MSAQGWEPLLFLALPALFGGLLALWLAERLLKKPRTQYAMASVAAGLSTGASGSIVLGWSLEPAALMSLLIALAFGGGLLYAVWAKHRRSTT